MACQAPCTEKKSKNPAIVSDRNSAISRHLVALMVMKMAMRHFSFGINRRWRHMALKAEMAIFKWRSPQLGTVHIYYVILFWIRSFYLFFQSFAGAPTELRRSPGAAPTELWRKTPAEFFCRSFPLSEFYSFSRTFTPFPGAPEELFPELQWRRYPGGPVTPPELRGLRRSSGDSVGAPGLCRSSGGVGAPVKICRLLLLHNIRDCKIVM